MVTISMRNVLLLLMLALVCTAEAARWQSQSSMVERRPKKGMQYAQAHIKEDGTITLTSDKRVGDCFEDGAAACAHYVPQQETASNFGKLSLTSNADFADEAQMRSAGYLEGYLTADAIAGHWDNMQWYLKQNSKNTPKLLQWLLVQRQWMDAQIDKEASTGSPFWAVQNLIMHQLNGMVEGYGARVADDDLSLPPLTLDDLWLLNSFGDMDDLLIMMDMDLEATPTTTTTTTTGDAPPKLHPKWSHLTPGQVRASIAKAGHCSAIIKVTSDLTDLLVAHTTWWSYSSLLRVYKHYNLPVSCPAVKAARLSFSSYPGLIHSLDDFMLSSAGLILLETSNDIYDHNLYRLSTNQAALSWQRTRAAAMMSSDGPSFAKVIQTHNSGTYNNQYMVVDINKFTPGQSLQAGLLTVIETLPGGAYSADTTQELERGYWPSYNIPYFAEVYNKTGVPAVRELLHSRGGDFQEMATGLSYQVAPRAKIFRRDSGQVQDLSDLKRLIRSNGWRGRERSSDPFSPSPYDAICARGDLDPDSPDASGCYDAKVTSYKLALKLESEAINGPAWDGDGSRNGHPAFRWRDWKDVAHEGMIATYDTIFELQSPAA